MTGLISCLMVTRQRADLIRRAVWCFQHQSYPQRELVVVNDEDDGTREYLASLGDERIRYLRPERAGLTLGELRNFGVTQARGDYVAQWDDDDWHHPDRLSIQLLSLEQAEADLCLLERWILAWPERQQFLWSKRRPWEGTLLGRRAKLPPYPPLALGEDSALVEECQQRQLKLTVLDRPDLYICTVHGRNNHPAEHFAHHVFNDPTGRLETDEVADVLKKLRQGLTPAAAARLAVGPPLPPRPSVCVLIPVHNQARHLFRAVASAIWQLEPQDELIVVDDASADRPDQAGLEPFRKKILWLRNPAPQGLSASRNRGVAASRADWIKFLDPEDVLAPFALEIVRSDRWTIPAAAMVVFGGRHRLANHRYVDYLCGDEANIATMLSIRPAPTSAAFVRRQALLDAGLFDTRIGYAEDWELWLRLRESLGAPAFHHVNQPACYCSTVDGEFHRNDRGATVEGLNVRDWLLKRYGPKD
jgi:glycosyltransferase involved in cell wall biosynthesis